MPMLIFMVGCPGSGKSVIAKDVAKKMGMAVVNTD